VEDRVRRDGRVEGREGEQGGIVGHEDCREVTDIPDPTVVLGVP
jgi:hypothetical protein